MWWINVRVFRICNFSLNLKSIQNKKLWKRKPTLPTHTHTHLSMWLSNKRPHFPSYVTPWWKGFMGELRIQKVWKSGENYLHEPWNHLLINIVWKQSFYNDRLQVFCIHQGNPIKEISDVCKAPGAQGVGWWSPGFRADLLDSLTCLLPGIYRAAVWLKPACPAQPLPREGVGLNWGRGTVAVL